MLFNQITASTTYYYNASSTLINSDTDYFLPLNGLTLLFGIFLFVVFSYKVAKFVAR